MLCFQSVLYCIVLYNDVFTFLYVAVGNKLLLLLLLLLITYHNVFKMSISMSEDESTSLLCTVYNVLCYQAVIRNLVYRFMCRLQASNNSLVMSIQSSSLVYVLLGLIVPIWKRKGDVHDPGKYRGITLLSQVLKLVERVLDAMIRRRVEGDFGEEQEGFRKGRGTADGMYVLRQMVKKRLEVQGNMALGFVDLEKAFDTVPREMVMATLRWMAVPEAEVRMVEDTYEKTTARVVVGEGASEEIEVKI